MGQNCSRLAASAASEVDLLGTLNKADNILEERGGESIPEKATFLKEKKTVPKNPLKMPNYLLSLLPFAHHSPALDTARATSSNDRSFRSVVSQLLGMGEKV
ncbi:hypothetical protein C0995_015948 [Termitomyces sp. Mi166|nr:hypothetical protein C0995_015948 [Termitomyces sp. Mi166\